MGDQEQLGMFDVEVPTVVTRRDEYGREQRMVLPGAFDFVEGDPDLGDCPYLARFNGEVGHDPEAICAYGCSDEPQCVTCEPNGGWPSRRPGPSGPPIFDGETFVPEFDAARLSGQLAAVYQLMGDGEWRTLAGIAHAVRRVPGCERATEASLSARLRDLRKPRFGAHTVDHRRRGDADGGFWEYRLVLTEEGDQHGDTEGS